MPLRESQDKGGREREGALVPKWETDHWLPGNQETRGQESKDHRGRKEKGRGRTQLTMASLLSRSSGMVRLG